MPNEVENSNAINDDDLDAFSAEFFGSTKAPVQTEAPSQDADDTSSEGDALDTNEPVVDPEVDPESNEGDDEPEAVVEKPKKKTAQERISELTAARYEAERKAKEWEDRFLEATKPQAKVEDPAPTVAPASGAPDPNEVLADGSPKYRLGEYDPQYMKDNVEFLFEQKMATFAQENAARAAQEQAMSQRSELQVDWETKLAAAEKTEDMADIRTAGMDLVNHFSDLEEQYGEYLATTIMSLDEGTKVFHYLANNLEEARRIANMGPVKATIALGSLDERFRSRDQGNGTPKPRISSAPPPPNNVNRGTSGRFEVPPDTDDLDAFETVFFKKKK